MRPFLHEMNSPENIETHSLSFGKSLYVACMKALGMTMPTSRPLPAQSSARESSRFVAAFTSGEGRGRNGPGGRADSRGRLPGR